MKYSYKWLQELSGTERSVGELVDLLTMHAFEVEEATTIGLESDRVVVGEVMQLEPHPNADKLRVAQVNIGTEVLTIVCGAPNIAEGQKVAVALVGAMLPEDFEIKKAKIRDVESHGMICSQKELGTGESHDGIWVLPDTAEAGSLIRDIVGSDSLLDIKVLPDRAHDCLSHIGMAREIAALEGRVMDFDYDGLHVNSLALANHFTVRVDAATKTKRYIGAYLRLGELGTSPAWLQSRLKTFGIRSIHPIVDVTNFVMLELGQPLHAFDWNTLLGKKEKNITVRCAMAGEAVELLDEKTYLLHEEDVVIADGEKVLAVAGVMGGKNSAVTSETTEILLESACFDSVKTRRTRVRMNMRTDASDRFEKGLSPDLTERALARAIEILQHIATDGSSVEIEKVEVVLQPINRQELTVFPEKIDQILGVTVERSRMKECLQSLGFVATERDDNSWVVGVPAWRLDIDDVADLAEEVGRILGYHLIPKRTPVVALQLPSINITQRLIRMLEQQLVAYGLSEVYNYSFYSKQDAQSFGLDISKHLALANPMNPDQALMRTTLLVGLLRNVYENLKNFDSFMLFEKGHVYEQDVTGAVIESKQIAGAIIGDFFVAKDIVENLFVSQGIRTEWQAIEGTSNVWHPTQTAVVSGWLDGRKTKLGTVGVVHPNLLRRTGIKKKNIAVWECSLESIAHVIPETHSVEPIRKFPTSTRDIAVFVPSSMTVLQIITEVYATGGDMLLDIEVFDRYEEKDVTGRIVRTSLAFRLTFGASDRTLSTEEVEKQTEIILQILQTKLQLEPRR